MKVVLLTTKTSHHQYYAWQLASMDLLDAIFLENRRLPTKLETFHEFESQRDEYEADTLLRDCPKAWSDLAEVFTVDSINDSKSAKLLGKIAPDVMLVFGTQKLSKRVIGLPRQACLNLHGGNPEEYRGLDSHLWAIYHNDFKNLVTTLHFVNECLDDGAIVLESSLQIERNLKLYQLRTANTKTCVKLSLMALKTLQDLSWLPSRHQVRKGRYYSSMPACLKEICVSKFEQYTGTL